MHLKSLWMLFVSVLMLTACMGKSDYSLEPPQDQPLELTKLSANEKVDQQASHKAKKILSEQGEIAGVRAVNDGKELLIGVKLNHHDRINMADIESNLRQKMKQSFSNMKVTLSTDKKIHLELEKLEKEVQQKGISKEAITKRLQKIKKLSKEET